MYFEQGSMMCFKYTILFISFSPALFFLFLKKDENYIVRGYTRDGEHVLN